MKTLLLAGTREARELAARWPQPETLIASLAGATRDPVDYPCATRVGGFGGIDGLTTFLRSESIATLIDATHPFAVQISENAATAAGRCGIPRLLLRRPPWERDWAEYPTLSALAAALPGGTTALLSTGRKDLAPFVERTDLRFVLRTIEDPGTLPGHIASHRARPPFSVEDEAALMRRFGITHLVTKNAGGRRPAKLAAAQALGLPILAAAMPPPPDGPAVETIEAALRWAGDLC